MSSMCRSALVAVVLLSGSPVYAQEAEIIHSWTSEGEAAAVKKFADAFDAAGGKWVDEAIAGGNNSRSAAVSRIIAGKPPAAAQFNTSTQFYDLASSGKLQPLDSFAQKGNWKSVIPTPLLDVATQNGSIFALPVDMSGVNFVFFNKKVLEEAGVTSTPTDWDTLLIAMEKVKTHGGLPIALGGDGYSALVFYSILADYLGPNEYTHVLATKKTDDDAPGILRTFQTFAKLRQYVDSGWSGRNWNQATEMLINGQAAFQIVGDWAKAEFSANKMTAGSDYGCMLPKGTIIMGGDVVIFPKQGAEMTTAQQKLVEAFSDPKAQTQFSLAKGSIPARTDVNPADFDVCSQIALKAAADQKTRLPRPRMILPSDVEGDLEDMIVSFFGSDMSPEKGAQQFSDLLGQ